MGMMVLAPLVVFAVSFVFPMLGMGGCQVLVPALFWMGMDFKTEAIPLALLLNLVTSSSAVLTYARRELIDWRTGFPFALGALALAPLGAWANTRLASRFLIGVFAIEAALASAVMLSAWRPKRAVGSQRGRIMLGVGGGGTLGFLCGLIGRGGGSLAVPMLYASGLDAKRAAATSLFVVLCSTSASFASHIALAAAPQWSIWIGCLAAALVGSQCGSRLMAAKLDSQTIRILFGLVLAAIAAALIVRDVILGH
ncbi:MAG: sulfite exporter TauE/SafE family protein [Candidatus Coatesbacteria bacterium]|nr:sulfite exporter TauE/SafE family protein [Candidatus Coatesbacteria bacterium]